MSLISIHVPAWGTTPPSIQLPPENGFQSTFPRGERPFKFWYHAKTIQFQSTFPRGERRKKRLHCIKCPVFQSTFPRGERQQLFNIHGFYSYFNPRSRVGNDNAVSFFFSDMGISIHVPAWGTTAFFVSRLTYPVISIHVPAWGTTMSKFVFIGSLEISIHVPAWGTTI